MENTEIIYIFEGKAKGTGTRKKKKTVLEASSKIEIKSTEIELNQIGN